MQKPWIQLHKKKTDGGYRKPEIIFPTHTTYALPSTAAVARPSRTLSVSLQVDVLFFCMRFHKLWELHCVQSQFPRPLDSNRGIMSFGLCGCDPPSDEECETSIGHHKIHKSRTSFLHRSDSPDSIVNKSNGVN